jgi:hypothetical protein
MSLLYNFVRFTLLFGFNVILFKSVSLPTDTVYFLGGALIFSIAVILHKQVLTFLTVKSVLLTKFIMISLLVGITFFILESILPGFIIEGFTTKQVSLGILEINPLELPKYLAVALVSTVDGFIAAVMYTLSASKA